MDIIIKKPSPAEEKTDTPVTEHEAPRSEKSGPVATSTGAAAGVGSVEKASFYALLLLIFALPIFFLPIFSISLAASKGLLLSILGTTVFFLWLIARLKDGIFLIPKSIILGVLGAIPFAFLVSAIFSPARGLSLTGLGFEIGTFSTIFILSILTVLASVFFQSKEKIFYGYGIVFLSAFIVFLFQLIRTIWVSVGLPFANIFNSLPGNILGKWVDMSIFFGFIAILALVTIELLTLPKKIKMYMHIVLWASLLLMVIVNFYLGWIILGLFALVVLVYAMSFGRSEKKDGEATVRTIPTTSFAVLLISVFFVLANGLVSGPIFSTFNVPQETISPSWAQTAEVAKETLAKRPLTGSGPNRFTNSWLMYKPDSINVTSLWNVDFGAGVGLIPSFATTTGAFGIMAFLIFFGAFLWRGVKSVFMVRMDSVHHYLSFSSFLGATYLWLFAILYVPNIVIFAFAFLMTGIFIASLVVNGRVENYRLSFLEDPRIGFVSMLVSLLLVISSVAGGYILFQKFISVAYFQKSLIGFNTTGDLALAERDMVRAIRLSAQDSYYRNLAELYLVRINQILSETDVSEDTARAQFQSLSQVAIQNGLLATQADETNYQNWTTLGSVYQFLMPFAGEENIQEFYQTAKGHFETARSLNPKSPALLLTLARLEIAIEDTDAAKDYIVQALNEKGNYTQAIFLLSQIQANEGDLGEAIASVEVASRIAPNDVSVFLQLGLLRYPAVSALERAVILRPTFSNAKYFLGLSYDRVGRGDDAIRQFEDIKFLNPENTEVDVILENLRRGAAPFANTPASTPPSEVFPLGEELPLEEEEVVVEEEEG